MLSKGPIAKVMILLTLVLASSFLAPLLPVQDPLQISLDERLSPPSRQHYLGTDELGRDVFSRVLHGYATTIKVSIFALVSSLGIGIVIGGSAGYFYKNWVDGVFTWVVSLIFSLPFLLVMAAIMSLMKPNIFNAYLILSLIIWVNSARIVRAEVAATKNLVYVTALRAYGASETHILLRAIMPGCMQSAIIFSVSYFPEIIGLEAALSFLGLGVQPPYPGLGKMIFDGLNYIHSAWWLSFFPAAFLFMLVLLINAFVFAIKKTNE